MSFVRMRLIQFNVFHGKCWDFVCSNRGIRLFLEFLKPFRSKNLPRALGFIYLWCVDVTTYCFRFDGFGQR